MTGLSDYDYSTPFQLHNYCIAFYMIQQTLIQHTIIKNVWQVVLLWKNINMQQQQQQCALSTVWQPMAYQERVHTLQKSLDDWIMCAFVPPYNETECS